MRRRWFLTAAVMLGAAASAVAEQAPRVVMISVDGLMPAYYLEADALGLKVPHLRRLMREGAYARVTGVLPTVTYPSHTTLITGVPPRLHGIGANTYFDPEERSGGAWRWYAAEVQVPTLVSGARARGIKTGSVSWPVSVGAFADWSVPEFWRPGSEHRSDLRLLELLASPGVLQEAAADRGRSFGWPLTDDDRTDMAVHILKRHRPQLLLLHIFDLDDKEHDFGPMTPEAKQAVEDSDGHIGQVLAALDETGLREQTLVAIVSDHGFLPCTQNVRPNALLREAGLLAVNEKGKIVKWQAVFHSSGGSAALHLAENAAADTVDRVRALIEKKAADPQNGLREILDAAAVRDLGGIDVPLLLSAREGFTLSNTATGEWLAPGTSKGTHGHVPNRPELQASLILSGPGVASRGDLGVVRMTSIAPTVARILGVELSREADRPLP